MPLNSLVYPCTFLTNVPNPNPNLGIYLKIYFPKLSPKTQKPKLSACILSAYPRYYFYLCRICTKCRYEKTKKR